MLWKQLQQIPWVGQDTLHQFQPIKGLFYAFIAFISFLALWARLTHLTSSPCLTASDHLLVTLFVVIWDFYFIFQKIIKYSIWRWIMLHKIIFITIHVVHHILPLLSHQCSRDPTLKQIAFRLVWNNWCHRLFVVTVWCYVDFKGFFF